MPHLGSPFYLPDCPYHFPWVVCTCLQGVQVEAERSSIQIAITRKSQTLQNRYDNDLRYSIPRILGAKMRERRVSLFHRDGSFLGWGFVTYLRFGHFGVLLIGSYFVPLELTPKCNITPS